MEGAPTNTHEQVYIDMSIIVIDIKEELLYWQAYGMWSYSFLKE